MDIFAKTFQRVWSWQTQFRTRKKSAQNPRLSLESIQKYLEVMSSVLIPNVKSAIQIHPDSSFFGLRDGILYLPPRIPFQVDLETQRKIYLNLVLQIGAARALGIFADNKFAKKQIANQPARIPEVSLQRYQSQVRAYLTGEFSNYIEFENLLIQKIKAALEKKGLKNDEGVSAEFWHWTTPSLEVRGASALSSFMIPQPGTTPESQGPKTEKLKPRTGRVESVDLKQEEGNSVAHSFEKLETADEYNGGLRMDSGDDELQDHSEALEELDLNKVTRGGEAAASVYRGESAGFDTNSPSSPCLATGKSFLYPEWSYRKERYMPKHCQLFENPLQIGSEASHFRKKMEETHRAQLNSWQKRIENIFNLPLWRGRLKEGDEIDCDAYVRDFPAVLRREEVGGRWYASKRKLAMETSVLVLIDQSLSTDSWVQNRRVLDVILESLGLAGILFEDLVAEVQVAGTWSVTRHQCAYQIYKNFTQSWDQFFDVTAKIEPRGYTRLGPALRHGTKQLLKTSAKKKLLLLLTDGKPTDLDGYEGAVGISDVKRACIEAESQGILPFALAIDQESKLHFPKMFNHFRVLPNPEGLAEEIYHIFVQLIGKIN